MQEVKIPLSVAKAGRVGRLGVLKGLDIVAFKAKRIDIVIESGVSLRRVGGGQERHVRAAVRLVACNAVVVSHRSMSHGMRGESPCNVGDDPAF